MTLELSVELKNKSLWTDLVFYAVWILLAILVACYAMFYAKAYLQQQKINEVNEKIAVYGSAEQKAYEKRVFDYKKKIDDFALLIGSHTISSQVFAFVEKITLPNVWFSNFSLSSSNNQITLSGETETMELLSRQVDAFEKSKEQVVGVSVVSAQVNPTGRIIFTLNLLLRSKILIY